MAAACDRGARQDLAAASAAGMEALDVGDLEHAETLLRRAALVAGSLPEDDPERATCIDNLGLVLKKRGRYREAEELYRQALALREARLGPSHIDVGYSLNNLGSLDVTLGRYREAEQRMLRADAIFRRLPDRHPARLTIATNLGLVYRRLGDLERAERYIRQTLDKREAALGPKHLDVARSLNSLGELLSARDRKQEAERLHERALSIRSALLPPRHRSLGESHNNLAVVSLDLGNLKEAETHARQAVAIFSESLGDRQTDTASALANLGVIVARAGKHAEAEPLLRRALAADTSVFGAGHPIVQDDREQLAKVLQALGRSPDARAAP